MVNISISRGRNKGTDRSWTKARPKSSRAYQISQLRAHRLVLVVLRSELLRGRSSALRLGWLQPHSLLLWCLHSLPGAFPSRHSTFLAPPISWGFTEPLISLLHFSVLLSHRVITGSMTLSHIFVSPLKPKLSSEIWGEALWPQNSYIRHNWKLGTMWIALSSAGLSGSLARWVLATLAAESFDTWAHDESCASSSRGGLSLTEGSGTLLPNKLYSFALVTLWGVESGQFLRYFQAVFFFSMQSTWLHFSESFQQPIHPWTQPHECFLSVHQQKCSTYSTLLFGPKFHYKSG